MKFLDEPWQVNWQLSTLDWVGDQGIKMDIFLAGLYAASGKRLSYPTSYWTGD
jgi:hypothetical protein